MKAIQTATAQYFDGEITDREYRDAIILAIAAMNKKGLGEFCSVFIAIGDK